MTDGIFIYRDDCEIWLQDIVTNHYKEALSRANSLLAQTRADANECWITDTERPRKTRFRGRQVAAYRFVYCVLERAVVSESTVIRHRCHNRLCCNPAHLVEGTRADNKRDDWDYWANGVDHSLL